MPARRGCLRAAGAVAALAAALSGIVDTAGAAGQDAVGKPQRIASLNLCTDQLLLALGARDRLVSVTFLASDPASSSMAEAARGLPTNRGRAEEILPLKPDLVLAGAAAATPTVALLKRLGHRVVVVPLARSLDDIPRHIATVARAIGEETRGREMIARFRRERTRIEAAADADMGNGPHPVALLFGPNGVTSGTGTLAGAVIEAAGFRNGAAGMGRSGVGRIPLETALRLKPRLLILSGLRGDHPSLATGMLHHPALRRVVGDRTRIRIHHHVWACGTPRVLEAVRRLVQVRRRLDAGEGKAAP